MRPIQRYSRLVEPEQVRYRLFVGLGLPTSWYNAGWAYDVPGWPRYPSAEFDHMLRRRAAPKIVSGAVDIRVSQRFAGLPVAGIAARLQSMSSALVPRPYDFQYCWRGAYLRQLGCD